MNDRKDRLGLPDPLPQRPQVGDLVRWNLAEGVVKFGRVVAYQANLRAEVTGLMVQGSGESDPLFWPIGVGVTVVDLSDPEQMMEYLRS